MPQQNIAKEQMIMGTERGQTEEPEKQTGGHRQQARVR